MWLIIPRSIFFDPFTHRGVRTPATYPGHRLSQVTDADSPAGRSDLVRSWTDPGLILACYRHNATMVRNWIILYIRIHPAGGLNDGDRMTCAHKDRELRRGGWAAETSYFCARAIGYSKVPIMCGGIE